MKVEKVEQLCDTIRPLSEKFWAYCGFLADARTLSNDKKRHKTNNRGAPKNTANDLIGIVPELLVVWQTADVRREQIKKNLFVESGGRALKGADASDFDCKSFDFGPNKRRFLFNQDKHLKLLLAGCPNYFCVLCPPFATEAIVSKMVPLSDVNRWKVFDAGYGAPSFEMNLDTFLSTYCSSSVKERADMKFSTVRVNFSKHRPAFESDCPGASKFLNSCGYSWREF